MTHLRNAQIVIRYLFVSVLVAVILGCGGGKDSTPPPESSASLKPQLSGSEPSQGWSQEANATQLTTVEVFKYVGSKQCQGGGINLDAMAEQLVNSGIVPLSLACGSDGLQRSTQCGSDDGKINIFEISTSNLSGASFMGYRQLSELSNPTRTPCDF